jgi:hypothetical protein
MVGMDRRTGKLASLTVLCACGYHDRQIVVMSAESGRDWLDLTQPQARMLMPAPAGTLSAVCDYPPDRAELFS